MARPLGLIAVAVLGTGLGSLEAQIGTYLTKAESMASAFPEAVQAREWGNREGLIPSR